MEGALFEQSSGAYRLSAIVLTLLLASACQDSTAVGARQPLSVSFVTATSAAGASLSRSAAPGAAFDVTPAAGATPVITKVQIALSKIELGQSTATCTAMPDSTTTATSNEDHEGDDDCEELELDPMLVELSPDTSVVKSVLNATVPAGTYTSFQAVIGPVRVGDEDHSAAGRNAFLTAHPEFAGKSVRIEGTYNGQTFVFESALRGEIESDFATPLVVGADGLNVTVSLDMAQWFKAADGTVIDPATAGAGTLNHEIVSRNIRRSFRVFEDDDHDGHDDHGEHR